jgi:heat shock protein HslJ
MADKPEGPESTRGGQGRSAKASGGSSGKAGGSKTKGAAKGGSGAKNGILSNTTSSTSSPKNTERAEPAAVHVQPVLASVDAELSADGAAPPRFKVREYNGVWPKETCVQAGTPPPLENTYWKLTRLDGKPVMTPANAREAYVVLKAPNQLTGHAGCNRLGGRYLLKRGELGFRGAVMTRMACLVEQDTESKLMKALKETSNWSIEGQYLHLFNAEGQQLARFEAVYLR